jgi:hypothetical protein
VKIEFDIPEAMLNGLLAGVPIPRMARVRQAIETPPALADVPQAVHDALAGAGALPLLTPGARVAVGIGSRGIGELPAIAMQLLDELHSRGCKPFIVPSMGSHGGATAQGQAAVLRHLGISEESTGVAVCSSMETVPIGTTPDGIVVHLDRYAFEADAIVFVARIKPHTAFHGRYESGLAKMLAIGLGNQVGAAMTHARGFGEMAHMVPDMAREVLARAPISFGLAVLENAFDRPFKIRAVPASRILEDEPALLEEARAAMPRVPFDSFDVLVLDRIGKNISGDGADPNITGRYPTQYASGGPSVNKQVVLDLTDASEGNANGIGTADFTTARAASKLRLAATYPNALTSTVPRPVAVPMILPTDRTAIAAAILTCNAVDRPPQVVRLRDTLHLDEFWVSEALLDRGNTSMDIEVIDGPSPMSLDDAGNLTDCG